MPARVNGQGEDISRQGSGSRLSRRTEMRYRLARLLTQEKFVEALNEARVARDKGEIFESDVQFVVQIVKAAERLGRVKIDRSLYPAETSADIFPQPHSPSRQPSSLKLGIVTSKPGA